MPVYEYICSACRHTTDIIHGINEPGPQFCPSCGAEGTMRKGFAPPAIVFKGSGWAKKDRSSGSRTKAAAKEEAGAGESTDKGAAKADKGSTESSSGTGSGSSSSGSTSSGPTATSSGASPD